ncbi:phosphate acetyltransferase [Mycoplasma sp. 'Moose RK']|uniref:phosphate acetyltransferase n=1 Tax=Mycoplasma sp. 'Moose RK' TaxID=2780095 RepID=UPI0018C295AF|nr:phosphate acetyltransferase [Mycoplasma sp. 'Moose RK']MBG0730732.1 phosphate acetyltransferase [Mycoplasma sp. 'Moose RK']
MTYQEYLQTRLEQENQKSGLKSVLIIDGSDSRAVEAAKLLKAKNLIKPILLVSKIDPNLSIEQHEISPKMKLEFIDKFVEFRKGKETFESASKQFESPAFYGAMLLKTKQVDAVIGGLNYPTAEILRAAFKVIGPKANIKTISSVMIVHKESQKYLFSDISVNIAPNEQQLVDIAKNAVDFALQLGFEPKPAFLSFSTKGSAKSPQSELVTRATEMFNANSPIEAYGEIQFDAALDSEVRLQKYKTNDPTNANVLIFPNLDAGNIGYKIAQRLGNFGAIGPIITGIAEPINDLSRGSTIEDIFNTALISALQVKKEN